MNATRLNDKVRDNKQLRTMEENMQSGCFQGHQSKWKSFARFLCIIGVFLAVKSTCVAQESDKQPVLRNRGCQRASHQPRDRPKHK